MKNLIYIFIVIIISFTTARYFFLPGYFVVHDDIQILRLQQLHQCLQDGQIPCRWSSQFGAGMGLPLFNYYAPLATYASLPFVYLGFDYLEATKISIILSYLIGSIGMYFLTIKLTKSSLLSMLSATLYTVAPYHSLDVFVRGAYAEIWALTIFPWVLERIVKFISSPKSRISLSLAIMTFLFFISHNIMIMLLTPLIGILILINYFHHNLSRTHLLYLVLSLILGITLSSYFIIPMILEKTLVHSQTLTQDYFDFRAHFASINQLFFEPSFWDNGASVDGPNDGLSFQVGTVHWILLIICTIGLLVSIIKSKFDYHNTIVALFTFVSWIAIFFTHAKSVRVWELIPYLSYVQFPWRLLGIAMISIPISISLFLSRFKIHQLPVIFITIIAIIIYFPFQKPFEYSPNLTNEYFFTNPKLQQSSFGAIRDYLPMTVTDLDVKNDHQVVIINPNSNGYGNSDNFIYRTNYWSVDVEINDQSGAEIIIPVHLFPGWIVTIDGQPVPIKPTQDTGLISFDLPKGKFIINGWLKSTHIQNIANLISLASLVLIILIYLNYQIMPNSNKNEK